MAGVTIAAAAKSLQSCPTLCDPRDGSPPGSPVPGILQARTLEWVAVSFSNSWKWKLKVKSLCRVRLLATPWTAAHHAPPSMGFSRQEYWSGVPLTSPFGELREQKSLPVKWPEYLWNSTLISELGQNTRKDYYLENNCYQDEINRKKTSQLKRSRYEKISVSSHNLPKNRVPSLYLEGQRLVLRDNLRSYQPEEGTRGIYITNFTN